MPSRATDRQALYEQLLAMPVHVRLRAAIALIDEPRRSLRNLLEPVLESVLREIAPAAPECTGEPFCKQPGCVTCFNEFERPIREQLGAS